MKNHYQVLGVSEGASQDQIEKRYLLLSHIWDPTKVVGEKQREEVRKKFQRIEDAYAVLSHPEKRKIYDRKLSSGEDKEEQGHAAPDKQTTKSKSAWKEQRPSSWVSDVPSQSSSRASTQTTSKPTTRCEYCRTNAPVKKVTFRENIGMVFRRRHRKVSGKLCKNCINSFFWNLTGRTMLLGWWGTISLGVSRTLCKWIERHIKAGTCLQSVSPAG